ncbi:MAG: iron-sulfur cluster-binding protein [Rhodospirillaceae bacterium]|jgi:L-lactate dehydrogenase complex protein LldF|nr:iron-sulfur cluster-binding protein [Rhodospirillaceae bacterium]|tara:strand:- start:2101 stop:3525 length:1425 start_codon:yes stop_codon:yes gene_type:complete
MEPISHEFKARSRQSLDDPVLQSALKNLATGFVDSRRKCAEALPEFEALRDLGTEICDHALANLDFYLRRYEEQVTASGGHVHWASTSHDACRIATDICRRANAKKIIRGKSMIGEEVGINDALEEAGFETVETDLGEYILQLAKEPPSHIVAPAIHKSKDEISDLFQKHHAAHGLTERQTERRALVQEARQVLRQAFVSADVGITGANFLIADTGSNIIVTNEGNGDLTCTLPRVHIVTAAIDKVIPSVEDAMVLLRLLGRSATGQEITAYTTFTTGPKRDNDSDGPEEYHVILVDNGRSTMLGNEFREMLRCIRCGACMNHCPVYGSIGGHAYGWVYPGPMGSVLTPMMAGLDKAIDLPNACTLNGRCQEVCPVRIPLPKLLRVHRTRQYEQRIGSGVFRFGLGIWAFFAAHPAVYHFGTRVIMAVMGALGRRKGVFRRMPLAGGWTQARDLPAPQGKTFQAAWRERQREKE